MKLVFFLLAAVVVVKAILWVEEKIGRVFNDKWKNVAMYITIAVIFSVVAVVV